MRSFVQTTLLLCAALGSLWAAHGVQVAVDVSRRAETEEHQFGFLPSPVAMEVASLGYQNLVADIVWIHGVLQFRDVTEAGDEESLTWFRAMLDTVIKLEPRWRTTYFYGGGMLGVLRDVEGSDRIYLAGMKALPEDHHFPFSLAMNAYLYRGDHEEAVAYLSKAADLASAPPWYRTAVGAFMHKSGQRRTAIRYLKGQLKLAPSDAEREFLQSKLLRLLHEELAEGLEERRDAWEATSGRSLEALKQLGELPPEPFGSEWLMSIDGSIRSKHMEQIVIKREKFIERGMLTRRWLVAK
jgi:tetratricopeptide (TPR) repeat protein